MPDSIDEIKALATTKMGFARSNRFLVTLPTSFGGGGGLINGILGLLNQAVAEHPEENLIYYVPMPLYQQKLR